MLKLREKIIVLYATAPDGFAATRLELRHKFGEKVGKAFYHIMDALVARGILTRQQQGKDVVFSAGPALREELGGTAG